MATTFALISAVSTPHAAFFTFHADSSTKGILSRSDATTGTLVNLGDLPNGPLKSYLTRTADWAGAIVKRKVIVKMSAAPEGVAPTLPLIGAPTVTQSEGASVAYTSSEIQFTSASSAAEATAYHGTIEIRLMHSTVL
jgi:hypothetical protein